MKNKQLNHTDHTASGIKFPLCFLVHDIDVPMNVGSFFRIADALGVEKIYLSGNSATPPNSKIKKTSRSAEKYVAYEYQENPLQIVEQLKQEGYFIVCLEITSESISLDDFEISKEDKICLVLGSENAGVCDELLEIADATIHIPMLGNNSSMNVANACSIASYVLTQKMK